MRRRSVLLGMAGVIGPSRAFAGDPRPAGRPPERPGRRSAVDQLKVFKRERQLQALGGGEVLATFNVALGRTPRGHKVQEGDGRTPEGHYKIVAARHDSDFYLSLQISYPNAEDRARARSLGVRPGGQIMIHGLDPAIGAEWKDRHWLFNWTNGCVAVTNAEMEWLWKSVALGTPIEILA